MAVAEFAQGMQELDRALELRKRRATLRGTRVLGGVGIYYGLAAYGSPIGAVTGVQTPTPVEPVEQPLGPQFGEGAMSMDGGGATQ